MASSSSRIERYIITGASRGIGRAIAVRLAGKNKILLLQGRDRKALNESCRLVERKGGRAKEILADLRSVRGVGKLLKAIGNDSVHLLVNNAAVTVVKPFTKLKLREWQEALFVNVTVPLLLAQNLSPRMPKGSCIVNILSIAARQGFPNWASYCATKFALEGLSQCLRAELKAKGIRVINIYPSATETQLWKNVPGKWPREKMLKAEEVAEGVYYAISRPPEVLVENIFLGNLAGKL